MENDKFSQELSILRDENRKIGRMQFKCRVVDELQKHGISSVIVAIVLAMPTEKE